MTFLLEVKPSRCGLPVVAGCDVMKQHGSLVLVLVPTMQGRWLLRFQICVFGTMASKSVIRPDKSAFVEEKETVAMALSLWGFPI